MPTDLSHLPPTPIWVIPETEDARAAVVEWLAHVQAGRIGGNPPPAPGVLAQREATAAQFAAYAKERRR